MDYQYKDKVWTRPTITLDYEVYQDMLKQIEHSKNHEFLDKLSKAFTAAAQNARTRLDQSTFPVFHLIRDMLYKEGIRMRIGQAEYDYTITFEFINT